MFKDDLRLCIDINVKMIQQNDNVKVSRIAIDSKLNIKQYVGLN